MRLIWIIDTSPSITPADAAARDFLVSEVSGTLAGSSVANHLPFAASSVCFAATIKWADEAQTPISQFTWRSPGQSLDPGSCLGEALQEVAWNMATGGQQGVLVMVTDGHATDDIQIGAGAIRAQSLVTACLAVALGPNPNRDLLQAVGTGYRSVFDLDERAALTRQILESAGL